MIAALIECKHCDARTNSSPAVARAAGWRMFDGVSQTGKPLSDVVCPSCAGEVDANQLIRAKSWDVMCDLCDWTYSEVDNDDFEPLLSEKEAKQVARDHECTPLLRLKPPHGEWGQAEEAWRL